MTIKTSKTANRSPIKFYTLGGSNGVGKHSLFFKLKNLNVLIDPGIQSNTDGVDVRKKNFDKLDAILLTHAHIDHIGALIAVMENHPQVRVYCTAATKMLVEQAFNKRPDISPPNLDLFMKRIYAMKYKDAFCLGRGIDISFIHAGHILGSASIIINTPEGNYLVTGDFATEARGLLHPFIAPDLDLRGLISEGSLVGHNFPSATRGQDHFLGEVGRLIENNQQIILPTDCLSVFQEMAIIISQEQTKGKFPDCPIFINNWLKDSFSAYAEHSSSLFLARENSKKIGWNFMVLEPFYSGSNPESLGRFCYFAGPAHLKRSFPKDFAGKIVEQGGVMVTDSRLSSSQVKKRVLPQRKMKGNIAQLKCSNHISGADLSSLIEQMRPENVVLIHGQKHALGRFGRKLSMPSSVAEIGEEIKL